MIDLVRSFKTSQAELACVKKKLFGWPKGLPSFTSSTLEMKKQPVNLKDDLRSTCFDRCLAPKPPWKKWCTDFLFIFDRD